MTKPEIIALLREQNPTRHDVDLVIYAEAYIEHEAAQAKVEKLGSIVVNEGEKGKGAKAYVDNPYIAVRDRTAKTMLELKLRTGRLWR